MLGLGPIGQFCTRIAKHLGVERVIGVDPVPERRAAAARFGVEVLDLNCVNDTASALIDLVDGRGPDAVIDAVGMEARGHEEAIANKVAEIAQKATGLLPDSLAQKARGQGGGRPAGRVAHRGQGGAPWRHRIHQRRLRR